MRWDEMRWDEMRWDEMRCDVMWWDEMRWDVMWCDVMRWDVIWCDVMWSERIVTSNRKKRRFLLSVKTERGWEVHRFNVSLSGNADLLHDLDDLMRFWFSCLSLFQFPARWRVCDQEARERPWNGRCPVMSSNIITPIAQMSFVLVMLVVDREAKWWGDNDKRICGGTKRIQRGVQVLCNSAIRRKASLIRHQRTISSFFIKRWSVWWSHSSEGKREQTNLPKSPILTWSDAVSMMLSGWKANNLLISLCFWLQLTREMQTLRSGKWKEEKRSERWSNNEWGVWKRR